MSLLIGKHLVFALYPWYCKIMHGINRCAEGILYNEINLIGIL